MKVNTLIFFILCQFSVYAQVINTPGGVTCKDASPICWDEFGRYTFENISNPFDEGVGDIACLKSTPRAAWFYLKIAQGGNLEFTISQWADLFPNNTYDPYAEPGLDVDFVLWGPFNNKGGNCNELENSCNPANSILDENGCPNNVSQGAPNFYNNINTSNILDCSYSNLSVEKMTINNANSGDYYVILITNYSAIGLNGLIQIEQTNLGEERAGSTDCSIVFDVDDILGEDQELCGIEELTLNANPNNVPIFEDYFWEINTGNGFFELPNTSGKESITITESGTYRVTITDVARETYEDEIKIILKQLVTPIFDEISPICYGEVLNELPTTSLNGITGKWTPVLNNTETTDYTFIPNEGQCAINQTLTIEVKPKNNIQARVNMTNNGFIDDNQTITVSIIETTIEQGIYEYSLDNINWQTSNVFKNVKGCLQEVYVRSLLNCSRGKASILVYPNFFSPNQDSYNDTWTVPCLKNNKSAIISIYDRYGKILQQIKPYNSSWNGNYNGSKMPSGDYWFVVEYIDEGSGKLKTYSSHFTLKR